MIILPRLHTCNGDLSKQWVIFYSVRNPKTDKMDHFKVSEGLNKHKTIESRTNAGNLICTQYAEKLKHGWSPFCLTKNCKIMRKLNVNVPMVVMPDYATPGSICISEHVIKDKLDRHQMEDFKWNPAFISPIYEGLAR